MHHINQPSAILCALTGAHVQMMMQPRRFGKITQQVHILNLEDSKMDKHHQTQIIFQWSLEKMQEVKVMQHGKNAMSKLL